MLGVVIYKCIFGSFSSTSVFTPPRGSAPQHKEYTSAFWPAMLQKGRIQLLIYNQKITTGVAATYAKLKNFKTLSFWSRVEE